MKLEDTNFSDYKLVIDEFDIPVAVQRANGEIVYRLYDRVFVPDYSHYYNNTGAGTGTIVRINRSAYDYFFGVLEENGKFHYVKESMIKKF